MAEVFQNLLQLFALTLLLNFSAILYGTACFKYKRFFVKYASFGKACHYRKDNVVKILPVMKFQFLSSTSILKIDAPTYNFESTEPGCFGQRESKISFTLYESERMFRSLYC